MDAAAGHNYLAYLFSAPHQRPIIDAAHALARALLDIGEAHREPEPAAVKLAWWQEQIEQLPQTPGRHPLLRPLREHLHSDETARQLLLELLTASREMLEGRLLENEDELRLRSFRAGGAPLMFICRTLGADSDSARWCSRVGQAGWLLELAGALPRLAPAVVGRRTPQSWMPTEGAAAARLTQDLAGRLLADAAAARPAALDDRHRYAAVLETLYDRHLQRLRRGGGLPPPAITAGAVWAAWRMARSVIRGEP